MISLKKVKTLVTWYAHLNTILKIIGVKLGRSFHWKCTSPSVPSGDVRLIRSCYLTVQVETNADMCIMPLHNGLYLS